MFDEEIIDKQKTITELDEMRAILKEIDVTNPMQLGSFAETMQTTTNNIRHNIEKSLIKSILKYENVTAEDYQIEQIREAHKLRKRVNGGIEK